MTRFVLFLLFTLTPAAVWADGYRCEGLGYRVKVYNHTQRAEGTRTPAVMVISRDQQGTLARIFGEDIEKTLSTHSLVYEGHVNGSQDGRFLFVGLEILKEPGDDFYGSQEYFAELLLNENHNRHRVKMVCYRYVKNP